MGDARDRVAPTGTTRHSAARSEQVHRLAGGIAGGGQLTGAGDQRGTRAGAGRPQILAANEREQRAGDDVAGRADRQLLRDDAGERDQRSGVDLAQISRAVGAAGSQHVAVAFPVPYLLLVAGLEQQEAAQQGAADRLGQVQGGRSGGGRLMSSCHGAFLLAIGERAASAMPRGCTRRVVYRIDPAACIRSRLAGAP